MMEPADFPNTSVNILSNFRFDTVRQLRHEAITQHATEMLGFRRRDKTRLDHFTYEQVAYLFGVLTIGLVALLGLMYLESARG